MSVGNIQPIRDERGSTTRGHLLTAASRDAAALCTCDLDTEPGPAGNIAVLRVAGEIDVLTIPTVHDGLTDAISQRPADLVIDLTVVSPCCVRGFRPARRPPPAPHATAGSVPPPAA